VPQSTTEVRFTDLNIAGSVSVGSRSLPSLVNDLINLAQVLAPLVWSVHCAALCMPQSAICLLNCILLLTSLGDATSGRCRLWASSSPIGGHIKS
jgi:hypothetical protein